MADAFKYKADVGVPSYDQIITFEHASGIPFTVSATTGGTHVSGSYHYKGNAVDTYSSAANMQSLAAWLYGYYPFILELIHAGGPGYFVNNGKKVPASFYGAATVSQHYNHVHCAMTLSGLAAARGSGAAGGSGTVTPNATLVSSTEVDGGAPGCLPVAATAAIPLLIGATDGIIRLVQHFT